MTRKTIINGVEYVGFEPHELPGADLRKASGLRDSTPASVKYDAALARSKAAIEKSRAVLKRHAAMMDAVDDVVAKFDALLRKRVADASAKMGAQIAEFRKRGDDLTKNMKTLFDLQDAVLRKNRGYWVEGLDQKDADAIQRWLER